MIFSKTRPVKIVMIGAGGTGGHIAPHLYRLLRALDRPVRFIVAWRPPLFRPSLRTPGH